MSGHSRDGPCTRLTCTLKHPFRRPAAMTHAFRLSVSWLRCQLADVTVFASANNFPYIAPQGVFFAALAAAAFCAAAVVPAVSSERTCWFWLLLSTLPPDPMTVPDPIAVPKVFADGLHTPVHRRRRRPSPMLVSSYHLACNILAPHILAPHVSQPAAGAMTTSLIGLCASARRRRRCKLALSGGHTHYLTTP